ncbi:glycosyltransferase family 4 protein [Alphaproteobacteria bacterium]|nr:glycosyltransferase family 4 protein [Alphaproteobacteria bacterium]
MRINTKQISVMQVLPHLNSGGLVSGAVEISKELVNSGFKSIVVSSGGYKENEIIRNNSILEVLPVHSKNIFTIFNNKKKLIDLAIKYNIHLIHARSRAPAWSAYFAAKELNLPFVTTFHGTYGTENFFKKKYNSIMLKGNAIIAISKFIKKHIQGEYGITENIYVIPRGVNTNIFSPNKVSSARLINAAKKISIEGNDQIILLPGRLTNWKGHKLAIKAISRLKAKNFKLVFIGDLQGRIKYRNELINLATTLNIANKVIFINHTRDLPSYLMLSDLVLSCSTKPEAFGRTVLEAQAMGKPVIAFNHGGSVELINDNENGTLCKVADIDDLAANIEKVLQLSIYKRKVLSKKSISNVNKKYLTKFMCKKTLNLYIKLIKNFREKNINN